VARPVSCVPKAGCSSSTGSDRTLRRGGCCSSTESGKTEQCARFSRTQDFRTFRPGRILPALRGLRAAS